MTQSGKTAAETLLSGLGARVRRLRKGRGLTAREVAERAGLSARFYSQLEGGAANIAYTRLAAVATALGVPLTSLVAGGDSAATRPVVALVGLRGAGKSTVGPLAARELGVPFVELDDRIEQAAGMGLSEVFALHGESMYRRLAERAVREIVTAGTPCVVALPGGVVHDEATWALVRERCSTVWLKARPADHMERVMRQGDRRPIADRTDAMGELRQLLASREPLYRQASLTVDTSRRGAGEAAQAIASAFASD